jgi:hypothetical protein
MKKWMTIGALAAMMAASAWAQSDSDYQGYMKAVFAANGSMQKNVGAKSADAAADAKKLQDTFKMVEAFWKAKGADDAVGFAQKAQTIAGMVATDVGAGDFDKAAADAKSIGMACGGCHMAHREGSAGNFKIKQ